MEPELFVSRIQRFSTADGPGIRTTVFLSGCPLRCRWCHNPETFEQKPVTLRFENSIAQQSGKWMAVEEVFALLMKDRDHYEESGGGITLSGGEPLLQAEAGAALLARCKAEALHTLLDTSGAADFSALEKYLPVTDLFYYDLKAADEETYRTYTGGSWNRIAENLKRLRAAGGKVVLRLPIIPGINDAIAGAERIASLAKECGIDQLCLLPYHPYGISKYPALGLEYPLPDTPLPTEEQLQQLKTIYEKHHLKIKIER